MQVPEPSRRQILSGLLGGLFAWLWPGKTESAAPPPTPVAIEIALPEPLFGFTTTTYDAEGNCIAVEHGPADPAKTASPFDDNRAGVSTYTYHADG